MEAALAAQLAAGAAGDPGAAGTMVAVGRDERGAEPEAGEAVAPNALGSAEPVGGAEAPTWPDDAVESAFLAEAKERGEVLAPKPAEDAAEEEDGKAMPAVGDLVAKIPAKVRDALEDLFRAKFVRVVRVPKKALKA